MKSLASTHTGTRIPTINLGEIDHIKRLFEAHVDREQLENYRLQVADNRTRVIVGLSGGADSTVLALFAAAYLAPHYPNIEFLFTDTKAEPESCYETLDKVERVTGIPITRIVPEKGLFEIVEHYNGFLPNTQQRYCTRELKLNPLLAYMKSKESEFGYVSLAGIRVDEADRDGVSFAYSMENANAQFPLISLSITKKMVFDILARSVGIPGAYRFRSRSGCSCCFFQRNAELIGLLMNSPADFLAAEKLEKLSDSDSLRWDSIPTGFTGAGLSGFYPVPAFIDIRKPNTLPEKNQPRLKDKTHIAMDDLFGGTTIPAHVDDVFVAYALYTHAALWLYGSREFTPGVYFQELITVSTSLNGIKSALGTYYQFRMTTPMPQYDLDDLRIVIAQIQFAQGTVDTSPPSTDSYTWKSGVAYKQLRHLVAHCSITLERKDLERRYLDALDILENASNDDIFMDAAEQVQTNLELLLKAPKATGKVVWEGLFTPTRQSSKQLQLQLSGLSIDTEQSRVRAGIEFDDVPRACIVCSL